jgi:type I restriction enzyme R subunit
VLTGFEIKRRDDEEAGDDDEPVLKPIGPGGGSRPDSPRFLNEIIDRLNRVFGDAAPLRDQAAFANQIVAIARENDIVMAQVENNTRDQAMKGNLPGAVQDGVIRALNSHEALAMLLKSDRQALNGLTDIVYELLVEKRNINLDDVQ